MFSTTFRWNDGVDAEGYEAVEATAEGLVWYAWSHVPGRGRHDQCHQGYEAFLRDGSLRKAPAHVARELEVIARARLGVGPAS